MPKYRGEWDPIDDPSFRDLQNREDLEQILQREIADIYDETDEYLLKEHGGDLSDPDVLFIKIGKIKKRMRPLPRPDQTDLQRRILFAEVRIIEYSVFYWQCTVDRFGFRMGREKNPTEYAKYTGEELKQELSEFIGKLDKAKHQSVIDGLEDQLVRLERYSKEPQAYNFDELYEDLREIVWEKLSNFSSEKTLGLPDSGQAQRENLEFISKLTERVKRLEAIVGRMIDEEIKTEAQKGVGFLKTLVERAEFEERSNYLLAGYRATVGDLQYRMSQGEEIVEEISQLREVLEGLLARARGVYSRYNFLIEELLSKLDRLEKRQKPLPEQDWQAELRAAERRRDIGLAYAVLGIFEDEPSRETIKKARNDLARKFHTDKGGDEEKIKQINAAYELIEKVRGWK